MLSEGRGSNRYIQEGEMESKEGVEEEDGLNCGAIFKIEPTI